MDAYGAAFLPRFTEVEPTQDSRASASSVAQAHTLTAPWTRDIAMARELSCLTRGPWHIGGASQKVKTRLLSLCLVGCLSKVAPKSHHFYSQVSEYFSTDSFQFPIPRTWEATALNFNNLLEALYTTFCLINRSGIRWQYWPCACLHVLSTYQHVLHNVHQVFHFANILEFVVFVCFSPVVVGTCRHVMKMLPMIFRHLSTRITDLVGMHYVQCLRMFSACQSTWFVHSTVCSSTPVHILDAGNRIQYPKPTCFLIKVPLCTQGAFCVSVEPDREGHGASRKRQRWCKRIHCGAHLDRWYLRVSGSSGLFVYVSLNPVYKGVCICRAELGRILSGNGVYLTVVMTWYTRRLWLGSSWQTCAWRLVLHSTPRSSSCGLPQRMHLISCPHLMLLRSCLWIALKELPSRCQLHSAFPFASEYFWWSWLHARG